MPEHTHTRTADLPLAVWPCAQSSQRQRPAATDRLDAAPGKMLPELARRAISAYSEPGDLVVDPLCGIGTTLVEAIQLDRDALGVESSDAGRARQRQPRAPAQGARAEPACSRATPASCRGCYTPAAAASSSPGRRPTGRRREARPARQRRPDPHLAPYGRDIQLIDKPA